LKNRPSHIVALYEELEAFVKSFGPVEFVTRNRYVLLRSSRIFSDLTITPTALRVVVHLPRRVQHALIVKSAADGKRFSHVAVLHDRKELVAFKPFLREAYRHSIDNDKTSITRS
jgi:hypothetical protein